MTIESSFVKAWRLRSPDSRKAVHNELLQMALDWQDPDNDETSHEDAATLMVIVCLLAFLEGEEGCEATQVGG